MKTKRLQPIGFQEFCLLLGAMHFAVAYALLPAKEHLEFLLSGRLRLLK